MRAASGVYPAVGELAALAGDVKAILGAETTVTYGADWTEYGAHVVYAGAQEVRFPLDALWSSAGIDAVGIDYYAPLSDWRDNAGHLDAVLAPSIYDASYLAANLRGGEAFDWYYPDAAARASQARSPITDGLGKPWIFRAKDIWSWWSNPHYERVAGAELPAPTIFTQSANHCSLKVINFLKTIKINLNEKYNTGIGNSGLLSSAVSVAIPATPATSPDGRALHPERMP